jgi:glycosyltransferase involved in cell wall biosynthesis
MTMAENQSANPSPAHDHPGHPRVAYLLADAGIGFNDSRKGCSIHARSMVRAFEQEGCQVDVYVMRPGRGSCHGFKVKTVRQSSTTRWWLKHMTGDLAWKHRLPLFNSSKRVDNYLTAIGWRLWQRDFSRHVIKKCSRHPPDLIYARDAWFSWPYYELKRQLKIPLFLEVNAVISREKKDRGENAFDARARRIEKKMFDQADRILPVSAELKNQIQELGIRPGKIVVTPNAVDMDLFHPARNALPSERSSFIIGAVNSMRDYHGMGTLLKAAQRLRDQVAGLKLILIGGGFQFEQIRQEAADLGVDDITEFTGVIDHAEVPVRLRECHACVAPYEGDLNQYNCPMKLYEYMSLKIPIVASRWGDIPNIVRHGETALLHAPGDEIDLADALLNIKDHPDNARERAEAAYQVVQQHTWRGTVRMILDHAASSVTEKKISER